MTVAASPETRAALGVEQWRFAGAEAGVVVRGLTGEVETARFWVGSGASEDEQVAHAGAAEVIVTRAGAATGDAALRDAVTAFRRDAELAHKAGTDRPQSYANVTFCEGNTATFGTAPFWLTTHVTINHLATDHIAIYSFRAGAGYEEVNAYPAPASGPPPVWNPTNVDRQWWAVPVTITYFAHWPGYLSAGCDTVTVQ